MARWWVFYVPGDNGYWSDPGYVEYIRDSDSCGWTCNKHSRIGDFGLLYAKAPISALVALFRVASNARYEENEFTTHSWGCDVECLAVFRQPLKFGRMRKDPELRRWNVVRGNFQPPGGRPPEIVPEVLTILAKHIPELAVHLSATTCRADGKRAQSRRKRQRHAETQGVATDSAYVKSVAQAVGAPHGRAQCDSGSRVSVSVSSGEPQRSLVSRLPLGMEGIRHLRKIEEDGKWILTTKRRGFTVAFDTEAELDAFWREFQESRSRAAMSTSARGKSKRPRIEHYGQLRVLHAPPAPEDKPALEHISHEHLRPWSERYDMPEYDLE